MVHFGGFGGLDAVVRAEAALARARDVQREARASVRRASQAREAQGQDRSKPGALRRLAGRLLRRRS